jgi:hypothetical protein
VNARKMMVNEYSNKDTGKKDVNSKILNRDEVLLGTTLFTP